MPSNKIRYVALYETSDGELLKGERTSTRKYEYASVVQWADGRISVGIKWSGTESGARNCLTGDQKKNGARVLAVVPAHPQTLDLTPFARQLRELLSIPGDS